MKVTTWSEKVENFVSQNEDLSQITGDDVIIHILETLSGPLRIAIDVDESITNEKLRGAIPLALDWKRRLIEHQGRTGIYSNYRLLYYINKDLWRKIPDHMKKYPNHIKKRFNANKFTKLKIATAINELLAKYLHEVAGVDPPPNFEPEYLETLLEHVGNIDERIPDPYARSKEILLALHLDDKTVIELLDDCLDSIKRGGMPFNKGYPLSKDHLNNAIRWFRGRK